MQKLTIDRPTVAAESTIQAISTDLTGWIKRGRRIVYAVVAGFILSATVVAISGAVVASGSVAVEGNYKAVQHLDGGIVSKILVKNGDRVKEGQVLLRLDPTEAAANRAVTLSRIHDLSIQEVRLEAERDRRAAIVLPEWLQKVAEEPEVRTFIASQRAMFQARRTTRIGEQEVLDQRIRQLDAEARGLAAQVSARRKEVKLNAQELASIKKLFDKGFANQQRLMPLQRESARLEGELARLTNELEKTQSGLAEAKLRKAQSEKEFTQAVVDELRKVQAALVELSETRRALEGKLARIDVKAPVSGYVHALTVHTEGGVVTPATVLMQVVPETAKLIVEAQVQPKDIDKVRKGLPAAVRFPAFNAQLTPRVEGKVVEVSAAQLIDGQGRSYFTAQIHISEGELRRLSKAHRLVPGMPAEVYIETSSRSILSFLVKPLVDAVNTAFRES